MIAGLEHTDGPRGERQALRAGAAGRSPIVFEGPGSAVWVFDTTTMEKQQEIAMHELTMSIAVSQGDKPRLYALDFHIPLDTLGDRVDGR